MAAANRLKIVVQTYGGTVAKIAILIGAAIVDPSGAAVAAIRAAIDAISKGTQSRASISAPGSYSTTSAAGNYEDDQDKMSLTIKDAVGQYHSFRVPAPKASCFQDGTDQVDLTDAGVVAFGNYCIANFKSKSGAALVAAIGGRRIRLKAGGRA